MMRAIRRTAVFLIVFVLQLSAAFAANAPVSMNLVVSKLTYELGEPIKIQINVENISGGEAFIGGGFWDSDFPAEILFTAPDGSYVRSWFKDADAEPGPPRKHDNTDCTPVDNIPAKGGIYKVLLDANQYYDLSQIGTWTAEIRIPLVLYSRYKTDDYGVKLGCIDDHQMKYFNPLVSNTISFEIVPAAAEPEITASIHVYVRHFKLGPGNHPSVKKSSMADIPVHLIRLADVPEDYLPVNWKTYPMIWENVRPFLTGISDNEGKVNFEKVPKGDYLVLGYYEQARNFKRLGAEILSDDDRWGTDEPIKKSLAVLEKYDGKKCSGKSTRRHGSELWIIEPEFVEWDDTEELYPFVLESEGDWDVVTSVAPPEGFVADVDALSAEVIDELEAVQFTVTDVGSRWEETEVTFDITHYDKGDRKKKKGHRETIKHKIGLKMSKKLARKKGLGIYGHQQEPGPFKGGKKIKKGSKN